MSAAMDRTSSQAESESEISKALEKSETPERGGEALTGGESSSFRDTYERNGGCQVEEASSA